MHCLWQCAVQLQVPGSFKSTSEPNDPSFMFRPESSSMLMTSPTTAAAAPWTNNAQTISFTPLPKGSILIYKHYAITVTLLI